MLWFAQNSLPLRWQRQFSILLLMVVNGCDLLKIHYLCGDKDNFIDFITIWLMVVICSKFITFAVTKTIKLNNFHTMISCDLLKIHYLCGDKDNFYFIVILNIWVVICSKFITFAVTKTIRMITISINNMLWFAQNSLPLRWQRQF